MSNVTLDNPYLLLILIPLLLIVVIPFIIIIKRKKMNLQNVSSLILHIVICALIALSSANLKTSKIRHETTIYVLADVSSSTSNVIEQMDDYIENFKEKMSLSSKLSVIAFSKDCQQLVKPGEELKSLKSANVDTSSTNLEQALNYVETLFEEEYKNRVIVLSDGKETDGMATNAATTLKNKDIRIDAVYFNSDMTDDIKEILIDNVVYNKSTFKNSDEKLTIQIKSNFENTSKIVLKDNDEVIYEKEVLLTKGTNDISVDIDTNNIGSHNYVVTLTNNEDNNNKNNTYYFNQEIHEKCEVLVIGNYKDISISNTINNYIGDLCNVSYLFTHQSISTNIENYTKYDEIILSNVDFGSLKDGLKLSETLQTLVSDYGKSLITLGGNETYFSGNFMSTKLKDMLPIDTNPNDTKEKTALVLVIDNSGSMDGSRLENAKIGAIDCLNVLTEEDYVGVITFSDKTKVVCPLFSLINKAESANKINNIKSAGGTMMAPGLEVAYNQIKDVEMENKQIILISDGSPGDDGHEKIVEKMAAEGIVLSTINLAGIYSQPFLKKLADIGKGRYYAITSPTDLPNIMLDEVSQIVMETVIETESILNITNKNDPVVNGITSLPNIDGYNFSKAKYNATTVIDTTCTLEGGKVIENVPLYTYWDYGSGKVSSFMSSINSSWSTRFFDSVEGKKFFSSMVKTNYPRSRSDSHLVVDIDNKGYTSCINVKVPKYTSNTEMRGTVTSPDGKVEKLTFNMINGKYSKDFNTYIPGTYDLKLEYINYQTSNVYTYNTSFNYSYSSEYDMFEKSDNILLWQITNNSGIVSDIIDEIVNIEQEDSVFFKSYTRPLIIAAIILFIIDVIIRKFKWKDIIKLFKKQDKASI